MSQREYWCNVCDRCEIVYLKYGNGIVIPLDPSDNPLKEFEATDVSKNVFRFVTFILWLRAQPHSFEWFLTIRARYPDLWKECLYRLSTL